MKKNWSSGCQKFQAEECAAYFREYPIFDKIFRGFREKYASYGNFSGTVILKNISEKDLEVLEGFFQKNFHGKKSISISAARFEKALKESRFEDFSPKEVLELYFREKMTGKKEQQQSEEQRWNQALGELGEVYKQTYGAEWLSDLGKCKEEMYFYLQKRYREVEKEKEKIKKLLELGCKILNNFPYHHCNREYLAVFAARITGNPHAFDDGERESVFLRMLIQWDLAHRGILVVRSEIFPALYRQRLYLAAGILRDDMSNCAMLSGIRAWKKNGELHEGMEGFFREGNPVQVPLSVIADWGRVECPEDAIYIVENPSVYAMLCGKWAGKKACMCMNGQPRLSAVLLLDLLADAGVKIYYAGDFDPEGMLIAQKIKKYYQGEAVYWKMSAEDYEKSKSKEILTAKRLKMLDHIDDMELLETAEELRKCKVAGYQENLWELW